MAVRPIQLACAAAGAGIALGVAAGAGRHRPPRALHRAAYAATAAGVGGAVLRQAELRRQPPVWIAVIALVSLPRTRPGTAAHATVAVVAASSLVRAART